MRAAHSEQGSTSSTFCAPGSLLSVAQAMPSMCGAGFPVPCDEDARQACLTSLRILDSPTELQFDRITSLVSTVFSCPIALVSFVDTERQ